MKKFFCCLICCCVLCPFAGCGGITVEEFSKNNLSEQELVFFAGSTQNFSVTLGSGLREEPYLQDGVKGEIVEYALLEVVPKGEKEVFGLEYTVEINGKTYEGVFLESPFDKSLAQDIGVSLRGNEEIFVYIILNNESEIVKLNNLSDSFKVGCAGALDIAIEANRERIVNLSDEFGKSIEVCVRVANTDKTLGIYFWYVGFLNIDGERIGVVIDPSSGEIIADM